MQQQKERNLPLWMAGAALVLATGAVVLAAFRSRIEPAPIKILPPEPSLPAEPTATPGPLRVYISGGVASPAVYEVPFGSILLDLVDLAGGLTAEANRDVINLALPLVDNMHVHVPLVDEENPPPLVTEGESPDSRSGGGATIGLVNINTASQELLETLPGIGPVTAQKIIDYRQENGPFQEADEILNVSGIGPVTFDEIEELITVR